MSRFSLSVLAVSAALCSVSTTVLADDMPADKMIMVTTDGKTATVPIPDKAMMADILKHAQLVGEDMLIFVWGNKFYVAKNEKMADGKMTFDYWGIHGSH